MSMSPESQALNQIREWLESGAVIRADSMDRPVLAISADGAVCYGGLRVEFPSDDEPWRTK